MDVFLRYGQTFPVPAAVADNLLKLASHDQLKVLLYVLCHAEAPVPSEQIERACNVTADAVEEALAFWQRVNILQMQEPMPPVQITAQQTAPAEQPAAAAPPAAVSPPEPAVNPPAGALQMSSSSNIAAPSQIAERIRENKALAEMFRMAEKTIGKALNPTERNSLFWMHEYLGLQPDLILMLTAYCTEQDCFYVRYMEKIALEWQERGIMTHAQVQADIQRRTAAKTYTGQVMRTLKMDRGPTRRQQEMIDSWQAADVSMEMLQIAYEKTLEKKENKLDLKFLNGIVQKWIEAGVRTPEQAQALDEAFYAALQNKKQAGRAGQAAKAAEPENTSFDLSDFDQLVNRF
ncbi:MAG: DnaD domain protein [Oscillospiraceae bacterium]|nr:DnaD domain protein [Oscillospiraceae bacterium]